MSDEKSNVIDLRSTNKDRQKAIKELLTQAILFVEENPDAVEAVLIISSKDSVATFKTAIQDPFVFLGLTELLKYRTLRDEFQ